MTYDELAVIYSFVNRYGETTHKNPKYPTYLKAIKKFESIEGYGLDMIMQEGHISYGSEYNKV